MKRIGLVCGLAGLLMAGNLPAELSEAEEAEAAFRNSGLQRDFDHFPLVELKTENGQPKAVHLTLNKDVVLVDGKRYDGFRFKVERKAEEDLIWVFQVKGETAMWYIVPEEGQMEGFKGFFEDAVTRADGERVITIDQSLDGGALKTGKTYLIWFMFSSDKPMDLRFALTFSDLQGREEGEVYDLLRGVIFDSERE